MSFNYSLMLLRIFYILCLGILLQTFSPFAISTAKASPQENLSLAQLSQSPSGTTATALLKEAQDAFDAQYYSKAEQAYDKLLELYQIEKKENTPDFFILKQKKILCLRGTGAYKESLALLESLIKEMEKTLGAQHKETLLTRRELAENLWLLGRYTDALSELKKTTNISFSTKEEKQQNSIAFVAQLYKMITSLGETLKDADTTLLASTNVLGQRHLYTLQIQLYMAQRLLDFGEHEKALVLLEEALSKASVTFPQSHPLVLELKLYMAQSHLALQQTDQAHERVQEVLALQENIFAPNHPELLRTQHIKAEVLMAQKHWDQAQALIKDILPQQKNSLGNQHLNTLQTMNTLATLLIQKKQYSVAKKLTLFLISTAKVIGNKNPIFPAVLKSYTAAALQDGDSIQAYNVLKTFLPIQKQKYGPQHARVRATQEQMDALRKKHKHTDFDSKLPTSLEKTANNLDTLLQKKAYSEALPLCQKLYTELKKLYHEKDVRVLSIGLYLGKIHYETNNLEKAQEVLSHTLPLYIQEFGYENIKAVSSIGVFQGVLLQAGSKAKSLSQMKSLYEALSKSLGADNPLTLVVALYLGGVYALIPDYNNALLILEKNLPLFEKLSGTQSKTSTKAYTLLATIYKKQGNTQKAQEMAHKLADPSLVEKQATHEKAFALMKAGKDEEAQALYAQEVATAEKNFGPLHTKTLSKKAKQAVFMPLQEISSKDVDIFTLYFVQNLTRQELHSPDGELFLYKLFKDGDRKNFNLMTFLGKLILVSKHKIRAQNMGGMRDTQQILLNKAKVMYNSVTALLTALGRHKESFFALSMLKAAELDDTAFSSASQDINIKDFFTPQEYNLFAKLEDISAKAKTIGKELFPLELRIDTLTEQEHEQRETLHNELQLLASSLKDLLFVQAPMQVNKQSQYDYLITGAKNLQEMQDILKEVDKNAIFIHTVTNKAYLHVYLTAANTFLTKNIKISKEKLHELTIQLREQLGNPYSDPRPTAQELYQAILHPIMADIEALQAKTLIFSLDGVLRYIPMSALHDGKQWLIEKYNIALFNEAARHNLQRNVKKKPLIAAMGVTKSLQGFSALPAVKTEIDGIVKEGKVGILQGTKYMDSHFNRSAFENTLRIDVPFVHVASHFHFDPTEQKDSFLLLGTGDKLTMGEMFGKNHALSFENVRLLTLSACDTASGLQKGDGREIESFGALAQQHGAKAVLASLWPVADASTAALMQEFYAALGLDASSNAAALAQAQRMVLYGKITAKNMHMERKQRGAVLKVPTTAWSPKAKADWTHPYFWAPFILMGNW